MSTLAQEAGGSVLGHNKVRSSSRLLSTTAMYLQFASPSRMAELDQAGREGTEPAPSVSICRSLPIVGGAASVRPQSQAVNMEMWLGLHVYAQRGLGICPLLT